MNVSDSANIKAGVKCPGLQKSNVARRMEETSGHAPVEQSHLVAGAASMPKTPHWHLMGLLV